MASQTITLALPEALYKQSEVQAKASARSLEDEGARTLARSLPAPVEDDLPPALRAELKAMKGLSDESLWQIAQSVLNPEGVALYDLLPERFTRGR